MNAVERPKWNNREDRSKGRGSSQKQRRYYQYVIGLGSNIAPRENLLKAVDLLRQYVLLEAVSKTWESPPVGSSGPNFLNAAVLIRSNLSPALLKSLILRRIEVQLGRIRTSNKNAPRTIDLDILVVDGQVVDREVWKRSYLALPVADLLPNLTDPETGDRIVQVAERLSQTNPLKERLDVLQASMHSWRRES